MTGYGLSSSIRTESSIQENIWTYRTIFSLGAILNIVAGILSNKYDHIEEDPISLRILISVLIFTLFILSFVDVSTYLLKNLVYIGLYIITTYFIYLFYLNGQSVYTILYLVLLILLIPVIFPLIFIQRKFLAIFLVLTLSSISILTLVEDDPEISPSFTIMCVGFACIVVYASLNSRLRNEERLRRLERNFRHSIDSLPLVFYVLDKEGIFLNSEGKGLETLGLKPNEVVGQSVYELYKDVPVLTKAIRRAMAGHDISELVRVYDLYYENRASPIFSEKGEVIGIIGVSLEVTGYIKTEEERQNLERQVLHSQKLESLGVLAGGIAHDFNNLLMGILGNLSLAIHQIEDDSPIMELLLEMEEVTRRATELTNQMLSYSGRGKVISERTDLSHLIETMSGLVKLTLAKPVPIEYDLEDSLFVNMDRSQIRQVILNIVTNGSEAIKHSNGKIMIKTYSTRIKEGSEISSFTETSLEPGAYAALEINDNGIGIDEDIIKKIFDPFFSTKFTGRGLGLAAVLGIVKGHKGGIEVESSKTRGTIFTVFFPLIDEDDTNQKQAIPEIPDLNFNALNLNKNTILICDDDPSIHHVLEKMVKELGFESINVLEGRLAIDIFKERKDDILAVVVDLTMPHMSGEEVLRELRVLDDTIPIVLSSGYSIDEIGVIINQEFTLFLQKPYTMDEFLHCIYKLVSNSIH
ncbi:MAG: hybrid sensor histidine kinase/response regulator [Candidatus Kariarchaeaceae archaeon]|jgi:PAS domain S-box-containing protein